MTLKIRFLTNFEIQFRLRLDRNRILKILIRIRLKRIRNFGKIDNSAEKIRFVRALSVTSETYPYTLIWEHSNNRPHYNRKVTTV